MTEHVRIPSDAEFGAFLLDANLLDAPSVERARRAAEATGDRFDQVLTKLGLMSDANLAAGLARYLNLPLFAPGSLPSEPILADRLPPAFVRENRILPVRVGAEGVTLAVVDPFDRVPLASVRFVIDGAILVHWLREGLGPINSIRPALLAMTLMMVGVQTVFAAFFLGLFRIDRPR